MPGDEQAPEPESDASPYFRAMFNIMYTGHWLTDGLNRVLKPFGLSEPQYNVLRLLEDASPEPLAQQDIQAGMIQKSSNVSRLIDKLETRGLVSRAIRAENRRKMDITLTPEGRRFLKKASRKVLEFHAEIDSNVSATEALKIARLLKKFRG